MAAVSAKQRRPSCGILAKSQAHTVNQLKYKHRFVGVFASQDPDAGTSQMSLAEAESILGVGPDTDFETIMRAKDSKLRKVVGDYDKRFEIEAAYDLLLMQNMKARLSGEMNVKNSVRFADVPTRKSVKQVQQSMISKLPGGGVTISLLPDDQLLTVAGLYGALFLWAFVQGAMEPLAAQQADVAGLQLALGLGLGVYFLRDKKRLGLGRSILYTSGGLILGTVIGSLFEGWVHVDIVPLLGMGSPGVFVAEFGLLCMAAAVAFLG